MTRPRCFLELPAGLAAVSLRLHGGPGCRPPISRMGNKAGYAEVILWTLGLRAGHGADAYLWAEADDDVAALLRCYPDAAMLRAVADIIRGWKDEEPRALWERLRAERKARGPRVDAEGTAGWMTSTAWTNNGGSMYTGPDRPSARHPDGWTASITADGMQDRVTRLAEYAQIASANRLINVAGPDLRNTGKGGTTFGGAEFATPAGDVAGAFEVAAYSTPAMASSWPPVAVLPRIPSAADLALWLGTPGDLDGVVVYMDPPYVDTTGYLHDLGRADVVRHALDFAGMGAHVAISEAVALPELMALGWYASEITGGRKGQKRTFSKQQGEYLTMNREPAYVVPTQAGLFACAS